MKNTRSTKKKPDEINQTPLREIEMTMEDWAEFEYGVKLFNEGKFWHSHEAWEQVWKSHAEDERLFFQGLIQLAAAYHQLVSKGKYRGMMNNFDKAYEKLEVFQPEYLGILVTPLLRFIEQGKQEAESLDEDNLEKFNYNLIPKLQFHKPHNPDLLVALREILRDDRFLEGVRLFNLGYHWEAHELWEDVWRMEEGDARTFTEAFVQTASGYSFLKLKKIDSVKYLFGKAIEKFLQFEKLECGIHINQLVSALQGALDTLNAHPLNGSSATTILKSPTISLSR